jgi:hypothetical protein
VHWHRSWMLNLNETTPNLRPVDLFGDELA